LVLGGIRAPRTARNVSEKSEPFGVEAFDFATRKYMQRDVEFEVDTTDKTGGFIGALYYNKTENVAISLLKEGLATIHSYSADTLPYAKQLYDAEVRCLWLLLGPIWLIELHPAPERGQSGKT
jgi:staphylococcal nuclease domain-containing protein 1